jgi:DNA-binding MltR family transcriptional regulator
MTSEQSPVSRLKKLAAEIPNDKESRAVLQELEAQANPLSDYAIALIGASLLEKALEVALLARFVPLSKDERARLFQPTGPLGGLAAASQLAYAIGVFGSKTRADIEHVRAIRNAFAHGRRTLSFETREIVEICRLLRIPDVVTIAESAADRRTPRGRYIETSVTLSECLKSSLSDPANVSKRRPLNRYTFLQVRQRLLA